MTRCPSWSAAGLAADRPRRALSDDEDPPASFPTPGGTTPDNDSAASEPRANMVLRTWGLLRNWSRPLGVLGVLGALGVRSNSAQDSSQGQAGWGLLDWKKCGVSKASDRIVGGTMAALGQYPWLARIGYNRKSRWPCDPYIDYLTVRGVNSKWAVKRAVQRSVQQDRQWARL